MIKAERFAYFDNDRQYHEVLQVWAKIPATRTWMIVSTQPVVIDPNRVPVCPTR